MSQPKIKKFSWGSVEVKGQTFKDVKIYPGKVRVWNWNKTGTHHKPGIQPEDVEEIIESGVDIVILSKGQEGRLQVMDKTIDYIKSKGAEVEIYKTPKAKDRYNELVEEGNRVGVLIHSTC